ncbi:MAG: DUF3784 domain-containing protein [Lachnospiraceae bacterium]|nr:DUF3784 domain-containing protein [Lachnospiraceae bacterium]
MNMGCWFCIVLVPGFFLTGLLFGIRKEKSAEWIAGFNTLPESEKMRYDKAAMVRDIRNSCFLWAAIMLLGAVWSYFLTPYAAIAAYVVWSVLFLKDLHVDARRAFEKYLRR